MKKLFLLLTLLICACLSFHAQTVKKRVAVFDPAISGDVIDNGTKLAVQELIGSTLVNTGRFTIVERSMIDKILKEQAFNNSDLADNSQATEIGKLAGANKVILSAVSSLGGRNVLSIKIIDVETATVDRQKTRVVTTDEILDVVEPLTLEVIGGDNRVKASTGESAFNLSAVAQIDGMIPTIKTDMHNVIASSKSYALLVNGADTTISTGVNCHFEDGILTFSGNGKITDADVAIWKSKVTPKLVKCLVIEDGITSIAGFSGCSQLTYVKLAPSVTTIAANCFKDCANLKIINIPSRISEIGTRAFYGCASIVELEMPETLKQIGEGAFAKNKSLTTIKRF